MGKFWQDFAKGFKMGFTAPFKFAQKLISPVLSFGKSIGVPEVLSAIPHPYAQAGALAFNTADRLSGDIQKIGNSRSAGNALSGAAGLLGQFAPQKYQQGLSAFQKVVPSLQRGQYGNALGGLVPLLRK